MDPNEKTLNTKKIILDAETEVLCNAERYQRTDARKGTRCP